MTTAERLAMEAYPPKIEFAGEPGLEFDINELNRIIYADAFKAGAEWQKEQECSDCPNRGNTHQYLKGLKDCKEQMLKEAVEGYVNYYEDSGGILMAEAQVGCPYHNGDKVKIIIVKEDKQ